MKRIISILILCILSSTLLKAQSTEKKHFINIGLTGGCALFFQKDLKELNTEVIALLPFEVQTINNFPPYLSYGGYVLFQLSNKIALGLDCNYYTTGSRIGAKDYSGIYSFDQILYSYSPGIQMNYLLFEKTHLNIYLELTSGVNFASWTYNENLSVGEIIQTDIEEFKAIRPFLFPAFKVLYPLNTHFAIAANTGYSFDLFGKYKSTKNKEIELNYSIPFSGPKITIAIEFSF